MLDDRLMHVRKPAPSLARVAKKGNKVPQGRVEGMGKKLGMCREFSINTGGRYFERREVSPSLLIVLQSETTREPRLARRDLLKQLVRFVIATRRAESSDQLHPKETILRGHFQHYCQFVTVGDVNHRFSKQIAYTRVDEVESLVAGRAMLAA